MLLVQVCSTTFLIYTHLYAVVNVVTVGLGVLGAVVLAIFVGTTFWYRQAMASRSFWVAHTGSYLQTSIFLVSTYM